MTRMDGGCCRVNKFLIRYLKVLHTVLYMLVYLTKMKDAFSSHHVPRLRIGVVQDMGMEKNDPYYICWCISQR